jgi:hypothetical protein
VFRFSALAGVALLLAGCSRPPAGEAPVLEYDKKTGRLTTVLYDANKNGKNDSTGYMDGTRIVRIELDHDENGQIERWDIYNEDRTLQKVGLASRNDGVMDSQAFYSPAGVLERIEVSTARNGKFNRVEFYGASEVLVRSEEDTDGDGRADKWDTYGPVEKPVPGLPAYTITSSAFDEMGAGRPTRRMVFGPGGAIARVEVDPDGDGAFVTVNPGRRAVAP